MNLILVTEIWGRTPFVDTMAGAFGSVSDTVTVIDPYDGSDRKFGDEDQAYTTFLAECGHAEYARRVAFELARTQAPAFLIGFSAGAGAVWKAVCEKGADHARGALCFYGSSIRTMTDSIPTAPVELIFPEQEPHFDVQASIQALRHTQGARCHVVPQGHGFMNPLSVNYDDNACKHWLAWIQKHIAGVS